MSAGNAPRKALLFSQIVSYIQYVHSEYLSRLLTNTIRACALTFTKVTCCSVVPGGRDSNKTSDIDCYYEGGISFWVSFKPLNQAEIYSWIRCTVCFKDSFVPVLYFITSVTTVGSYCLCSRPRWIPCPCFLAI